MPRASRDGGHALGLCILVLVHVVLEGMVRRDRDCPSCQCCEASRVCRTGGLVSLRPAH